MAAKSKSNEAGGEKLSSQGLRSGSFIIIISVIVIIAIAGFDKLGPDSSPTKHIIKKNNS